MRTLRKTIKYLSISYAVIDVEANSEITCFIFGYVLEDYIEFALKDDPIFSLNI
jgi:hypothetical protein